MNFIDKVISQVSPKWAAGRIAYRRAMEFQASYRGAYPSRASSLWSSSESMSAIPHLNYQVARMLRDRARSLVENNLLASSILDRAVENIIGHGYRQQAMTDDPEWNDRADDLMEQWLATADYHGRPWLEFQRILCYCLLRDGDVGAAMLSNGQLQLIEGDYISSPYNKWKRFYHDGVEVDKTGRVKNYWIMNWVDGGDRTWKAISPRYFAFIAQKRRGYQFRGETSYAQSFDLIDQINGYIDAVVIAQKIAACMALFIKTQDPVGSIAGLSQKTTGPNAGLREFKIEPGIVQRLGINEDIAQVHPAQPGEGFDDNLRMLLRLLGISFGLPLEYLLLDFSTVSGNTAKASAQVAQDVFETKQRLMRDVFYVPMRNWRIRKFIAEGKLPDRPDAERHIWHAPPWPYVDPVKEIQAIKLAIDSNLSTEKREAMKRGIDYDSLIAERASEEKQKLDLNLPLYHSALLQSYGQVAETVTVRDEAIDEENGPQPAKPSSNAKQTNSQKQRRSV